MRKSFTFFFEQYFSCNAHEWWHSFARKVLDSHNISEESPFTVNCKLSTINVDPADIPKGEIWQKK
jgi:hypothetical protein